MNDFIAEDYRELADEIRNNLDNRKVFDALMSNNCNVILGALEDAETLKMLGGLKARGYSGKDVASAMGRLKAGPKPGGGE
jgi:hypothetical protein